MTSRHLTAAALGVAVAALVAIGALTYSRVGQLVEDARGTAHARELVDAATAVLAAVRDAESAQRGYLLSADDTDFTAYRDAQRLLSRRLEILGGLATDDAAVADRVERLRSAVEESRELTAGTMELRRDGLAPADAIERHRQSRQVNARVRTLGDDLINSQVEALAQAESATRTRAAETRWLIIGAFLLAAAASLFASIRGFSELGRRRHDLSDATARLRSRDEQFHAIAEVSPFHLFAAEADGSLTYISPGFAALTGVPTERALGFGWTGAVHPEDRAGVIAAWQGALRSGDPFQSEFRFREEDGHYRWFKAHIVPVRSELGAIDRWVGAAADVNDQHEALAARAAAVERERQAREDSERANQLKDEFLATISHELRTPLNAIVGWAHVLHTGVLPATDMPRAVEAIERNARAQARAIDDLLDVSRMMQGGLTLSVAPCDLRLVVSSVLDTVEPAASSKGLAIAVDTNGDDVHVVGDEARLRQVVWNLLSNAVKFSPRAGRVSLDLARAGDQVCLRVTDHGEGIDPAFLPHVFDPFRQGPSRSMRAGLGLGLAIARQLVGLHGGSIAAESDGVGRGATFTVMLPAYEPRPPFADRISA